MLEDDDVEGSPYYSFGSEDEVEDHAQDNVVAKNALQVINNAQKSRISKTADKFGPSLARTRENPRSATNGSPNRLTKLHSHYESSA